MEIIREPRSIKMFAEEIKKVMDLYWNGKITEGEAREYINHWKADYRLIENNELNSTIKKIIGKKRVNLLFKWLDD